MYIIYYFWGLCLEKIKTVKRNLRPGKRCQVSLFGFSDYEAEFKHVRGSFVPKNSDKIFNYTQGISIIYRYKRCEDTALDYVAPASPLC